jgi:hypothetical protein
MVAGFMTLVGQWRLARDLYFIHYVHGEHLDDAYTPRLDVCSPIIHC